LIFAAINLDETNKIKVMKHIKPKIMITITTFVIDFSAPTKFIAVDIVRGQLKEGFPTV